MQAGVVSRDNALLAVLEEQSFFDKNVIYLALGFFLVPFCFILSEKGWGLKGVEFLVKLDICLLFCCYNLNAANS